MREMLFYMFFSIMFLKTLLKTIQDKCTILKKKYNCVQGFDGSLTRTIRGWRNSLRICTAMRNVYGSEDCAQK